MATRVIFKNILSDPLEGFNVSKYVTPIFYAGYYYSSENNGDQYFAAVNCTEKFANMPQQMLN
jgi:YHS domain-containing protein